MLMFTLNSKKNNVHNISFGMTKNLSPCFIFIYYISLSYSIDIKVYTIVHIKSSHPNFEVIMNVN